MKFFVNSSDKKVTIGSPYPKLIRIEVRNYCCELIMSSSEIIKNENELMDKGKALFEEAKVLLNGQDYSDEAYWTWKEMTLKY